MCLALAEAHTAFQAFCGPSGCYLLDVKTKRIVKYGIRSVTVQLKIRQKGHVQKFSYFRTSG